MKNISTKDLLDSIKETLREDYSSSLFNTNKNNKELDDNLYKNLKLTEIKYSYI